MHVIKMAGNTIFRSCFFTGFVTFFLIMGTQKVPCWQLSNLNTQRSLFGIDARSEQEVSLDVYTTWFVQLKRVKVSSNLSVRISVSEVSKHGLIVLALPSKLYTVDILISMDIHPNPGPRSLKLDLDNLYFPPKLVSGCKDRINYSRSELLGLRLQYSITPGLYFTLKLNNLFYEKGLPVYQSIGERQSVPVLSTSRRSERSSFRNSRQRNLHNLVNIPYVSSTARIPVDKPLQLGLFNARSLNNKALAVKDYVVDHELDLLALTETWIKADSTSTISEICPRGFNFYHTPRASRRGGGVGLMFNKSLKILKQQVENFRSFEAMEVLLHTQSSSVPVRIIILYRLHHNKKKNNLTADMFHQDFSQLLERLVSSSGKLLLLGDFNLHVDQPVFDCQAAKFLDLLNMHSLTQHVTVPTHRSGHTLDLVITRNNEDVVCDYKVHDPCLSDHYVVHCSLSLKKPQTVKTERTYRKLRSVNIEALRKELVSSKLFLSPACSVSDLSEQYSSELSRIVNSFAPLKKRVMTLSPAAPWYTDEIAAEKTKRRKLERRWRKSNLHIDHQLYKDQCERVRNLVKSAKMNFYSSVIQENSSNPRLLFKTVDRLLHRSTEKKFPSCNSKQDLCNNFSNFFANKLTSIRSELPIVTDDAFLMFCKNLDNPRFNRPLENFSETSENELWTLIRKPASKSCELDPIPAQLLINCLDDLLPVITKIVNLSLASSTVPTSLKQAILSPLLKKPMLDHELYSNFRPVSNLEFLSKAIEKVVATRVLDHLQENDLQECFQSAYKMYHSCETALVRVQNDILQLIDSDHCVVLLLLDLSAAFDTVDHQILLDRMSERFGIKGNALAWFASYLGDRTQFVSIDGRSSNPSKLICGVPQGSVLGPLLYLLYTSPLGDIMRKHNLSFHMYADDNQVYSAFKFNNEKELAITKHRIQLCVSDIDNWMAVNKLKLNKEKTELLLLHSRFRNFPPIQSFTFENDTVNIVAHARNIGVTFDSLMSYDKHINNLVKTSFFHLRNIAKIRNCLSDDVCKIVIQSLVCAKIDNCNALLYGLPKKLITKLQSVQNAAARIIARKHKYDHITATLKQLHWLPIEYRIMYKINLLTFKCLHDLAPAYLTELINVYKPKRTLRSSSKAVKLETLTFNTKTYGFRSFSVHAPHLWNDLPENIRSVHNLSTFKSYLKTHLFKLAFDLY